MTVDFDLHGIVGIRLLDATPSDVQTVVRQLGPLQQRLDREADITIRFVDRFSPSPLTHVGLGDGGFNDEGFFVVQGKGNVPAKALVPFDQIGRRPEIVCQRGIPAVPHLVAIVNLTALTKGVLPLHASAFSLDGTGVLVTGWAKGGKTETLLACMARGADYVGDEWVYLTADGDMYGLPEPIRLWSWHLRQLPALLRSRPRHDRLRLAAWHQLSRGMARAARARFPGDTVVRKGAPVIGRQAYLQVPPTELFGADAVVLRGRLDAVVLVVSHDLQSVVAEPVRGAEVASRMAASLRAERALFMEHYLQFLFAFPHAPSEVVETANAVETGLLATLFDHRLATKVAHPYPCDIAELGRAVTSGAVAAR